MNILLDELQCYIFFWSFIVKHEFLFSGAKKIVEVFSTKELISVYA